MESSSCAQELRMWRTVALTLIAIITTFLIFRAFVVLRMFLARRQNPGDKPLYVALDDGEHAEFSDSMSDSSSLFSPPFRPSVGIAFKTAAANVSQTEIYLQDTASSQEHTSEKADADLESSGRDLDDYLEQDGSNLSSISRRGMRESSPSGSRRSLRDETSGISNDFAADSGIGARAREQ
ncbi:Hypothetical Protein FCC1311_023392 [Hondaea fermentalgiana]|uniref:Uncharacterized protein n=1 Tax=Hondaea fermentalgiana TaxID=2315210 RepID=A0A2R5G723_9STRA|nr:Hypothetical Protein FCC1311_023392 [Hondaea fermentalgiana]|eukprot:GBG26119.1 Hypothetical Protein FCC1311_023392 [Hondaea fermentalgiana]